MVRLNVSLRDVHKKYDLDAKVVWTTKKGKLSGGKGIGVEFMKGSDVYRNLLSKL